VIVGVGWDVRTTTGAEFDLDASAIVLGADGKAVLSTSHFIFFNNLTSARRHRRAHRRQPHR
jgi:tellurium resistance protein TerD